MPKLAQINGILVDVAALRGMGHKCDPTLCRKTPSCCGQYEVCVETKRLESLIGCMPAAAKLADALGDEDANPFDPLGAGLYAIDTNEDGLCVFAYRDGQGRTLCSLHSAAMAAGVSPYRVKPTSCSLWPLAMNETAPPVLTVDGLAMEFPCNRRRRGRPRTLDAGIAEIIRGIFGQDFLDSVQRLL